MSAFYRLARTIDVSGGFVADADPRTTPPVDGTFVAPGFKSQILYYLEARDAGGARLTVGTFSSVVYCKDPGSGLWVLGATTNTFNNVALQFPVRPGGLIVYYPSGAEYFVRLTALAVAGAATLRLYYIEV